ncbi:hypothetical protein [Psychrobacillus sp. FSL K6-1267]|uniref:hypothetical protein n=1 Tax=Psychrobacillus sp. FSL K6-1267 TaxID=2921543 RepID=UPI0030FCA03A
MSNSKVMVTKEVAEAIEELINGRNGFRLNPFGIIKHLDNVVAYGDYPKLRVLNEYYSDSNYKSNRHPNVLLRALVNGYEVEKSPEEKVREYYESYGGSPGAMERKAGVQDTLDLLGIKIKGVNS